MGFCGNTSFWDWQLSINSTQPRLSECFQETVLVYVPIGFLWLVTPVQVVYLTQTRQCSNNRHSNLSTAKTATPLLLAIFTVATICKDVSIGPPSPDKAFSGFTPVDDENRQLDTVRFIAQGVEIISFILAAILVQVERSYYVITSGVLFIYSLLLLVTKAVPFYTAVELQIYETGLVAFVFNSVIFLLVLIQFFLHCPSDLKVRGSQAYCNTGECPELTASFLSKLTFAWMTRLILIGYKRSLQSCDLWPLNPRDNGVTVQRKFFRFWRCAPKSKRRNNFVDKHDSLTSSDLSSHGYHDQESYESSPLLPSNQESTSGDSPPSRCHGPSLVMALVRAFGSSVALSYLLKLVSDSLQFIAPFLLKSLIVFIDERNIRPGWQGYFLAGAMLVTSLLQTVFYHQHYHLAMTSGMRMKSALMAAVYQKSLRVGHGVRTRYSVGELVNMMSVDCQRIQDMMSYTWMVWSIPYQVTLAVYLLWGTLGAPVLAGLTLLLLLVPINAMMAYCQQHLQRSNLKWKDRRIRMLSEVLSGIKVLKLYSWENSFLDRILSLRGKEVTILTRLAWINAMGILIWTCAPYLVCLASFTAFVMSQSSAILTADMAFVTLSLFNILQFPIAFIPEMVSVTAQARVSIRRLREYLCEPELHKDREGRLNNARMNKGNNSDNAAISLSKATLTWDTDTCFHLRGLNVQIPRGSLVTVVGPVCCGKSSFLSALLGEMNLVQGNVFTEGSIAYVPQEAWLQNASIRDNILFGSTFNAKKYKRVIDSCALTADFSSLPKRDGTEIGEKGINLSGGQKQRISLARAVYAQCDVYLLDDSLRALDTHVAKHVFNSVISNKGFLRQKTRVFVTHAVHLLPLSDVILVMQDGCLVEQGTYRHLIGRDGPLARFLLSCLKKDMDGHGTCSNQDEEIMEIKRLMWEHVESATSQSDATTSGDDVKLRNQKFHFSSVISDPTSGVMSQATSSETLTTSGGSRDSQHGYRKTQHAPEISQMTEEENLTDGNVKLSVYKEYCKNLGLCCSISIVVMFALYQTSSVLANVWLSKWTSDDSFKSVNATPSEIRLQNDAYVTIYASLGAGQVIFIFIYACIASLQMVKASSKMHAAMLRRVIGAPMHFYDTTPLGQILNRFSRDVEILDNNLPQIFFMWIMCVFSVLATITVVCAETPIFMAVVAPLFAGYWAIQRFFVPTSRQLKRHEAITRSPVFSHFSETLTGCQVIRAYRRQTSFMATFTGRLDKNLVMYFAGITANRWLGVWIETVSSLVVMATAVFSLITPGINGATLGLSVTYALQVTQALKWLVRTMSDIESSAVSVERINEYSVLPQEAPGHREISVPGNWPEKGKITIQDLTVRYKDHLDPVLYNLTCSIKPGEKIAVVGRTGAGKSSLTLALFRILEASRGKVFIDEVNIADIDIYHLRSRMTILPQDPVILSGSLRMNLDPKGQHLDDELWRALTLAHLKDTSLITCAGLDSDLGENGARLSMGQRQLLCLARALLRHTKILVMDEPTSCVDPDTDGLVQRTIMSAFKDCTIITISHRIQSVLNYDRVMVLQDGRVVEFDCPGKLLEHPNSVFAQLNKSAGNKPNVP